MCKEEFTVYGGAAENKSDTEYLFPHYYIMPPLSCGASPFCSKWRIRNNVDWTTDLTFGNKSRTKNQVPKSIHPSMHHPFNYPSRNPTTLPPTNTPPPPLYNASQILRLNNNPKFPRQMPFVNSFGLSIGAYSSGTQSIHLCISPINNGNLFKELIICITSMSLMDRISQT